MMLFREALCDEDAPVRCAEAAQQHGGQCFGYETLHSGE